MKRQKLLVLLGAIFLVLMLVALPVLTACAKPVPPPAPAPAPAPAPKPEPKEIVLTAAMFRSAGVSSVALFEWWVNRVHEYVKMEYPGELRIDVLGGPEVVPYREAFDILKGGAVDLFYGPPGYYTGAILELQAASLNEWTDYESREQGIVDYFNRIHEERYNIHLVGFGGYDTRFFFWSKKLVPTPDFTGIKLRVSGAHILAAKALNATPVSMGGPEVYEALERGVVDGICTTIIDVYAMKTYEHLKYLYRPGFFRVVTWTWANLDSWNSLPKHLQDLLTKAAMDGERHAIEMFGQMSREEVTFMEREWGLQTVRWSPEDIEYYQKRVYDYAWDEVLKLCPETGPTLRELLTKPAKLGPPIYGD